MHIHNISGQPLRHSRFSIKFYLCLAKCFNVCVKMYSLYQITVYFRLHVTAVQPHNYYHFAAVIVDLIKLIHSSE